VQSAVSPGYYCYWGAAACDSVIGYYSYTLGTWHIVVINSSLDMSAGSTQERWLRADLAAHPATCTLAYWHHPRFSSGGNGSTVETQPIWQALYDFGAEVVLNGHDHDYERFAPQTPTGALDNTNGIREFVVGTGGNSLYSFDIPPIANSQIRSNVNYGVIKLTLWPTSYDWQFIPVAGGTFADAGSASCHSGSPLPNQAPVANPGGPYNSEGTVVLDGSQSRDPDNNTPITYAWDLGDGTTATTPTVTHTYPSDGSYVGTFTDREPATSRHAARMRTKRRRRSWTAFRALCSRSATTSTRAAARRITPTATPRRGDVIRHGRARSWEIMNTTWPEQTPSIRTSSQPWATRRSTTTASTSVPIGT